MEVPCWSNYDVLCLMGQKTVLERDMLFQSISLCYLIVVWHWTSHFCLQISLFVYNEKILQMSPKSEMLFLYTLYIQPNRWKSEFFTFLNFLFRKFYSVVFFLGMHSLLWNWGAHIICGLKELVYSSFWILILLESSCSSYSKAQKTQWCDSTEFRSEC